MGGAVRIIAIGLVFCATSAAWIVLGGLTSAREREADSRLKGDVQSLWGRSQHQKGPELTFRWQTTAMHVRTQVVDGVETQIRDKRSETHERPANVDSSDIQVSLSSDLRRRGLVWYSLYDVAFEGAWSYEHSEEMGGELEVSFTLPDTGGMYDDFVFEVDGVDRTGLLDASEGVVKVGVPVEPGQRVRFRAGYESRGMDDWLYLPSKGVGRLEDFTLRLGTDFAQIDFPAETLSPSSREREGPGWVLEWRFEQLVSGTGSA
ncbi:MAG: hypothetical protein MJD61_07275 [Proteobacteria bacterium]|nr:hypothetical protein [Pseudomonadota bacterium]